MGKSVLFRQVPDHGEGPVPTIHEREEYHNFLEHFIDTDIFSSLPEETQTAILVSRDTLCWTLGHENGAFELNIHNWSEFFKDHYNLDDSFHN